MRNSGLLGEAKGANTGKLISAYYLEVEYLLERIEGAGNHYQALGLERTATQEEVVNAYQQAVSVLHPHQRKVRAALPDEMMLRVDEAFRRISEAFGVLAGNRKRVEYDKSIKRSVRAPLPIEVPADEHNRPTHPADNNSPRVSADKNRGAADVVDIKIAVGERPVFTKSVDCATDNRRRCERFKLTVPALVAGYDQQNKRWQEVTKTVDVGRMGAAVRMQRRVRHGTVVHVTLPLPIKLRSHGFSDAGYNMYAIIRRIEPVQEGLRVVGLEFIGNHPPAGYLDKPWAIFRTQRWNGPNRRREPRVDHIEPLIIEYLDENRQPLSHDSAVTENISPSGARVCIRAAPPEFEYVRIARMDRSFHSLALVRNQYSGKDGFDRLCIQFVDNSWPV